jgi:hypothetical protein
VIRKSQKPEDWPNGPSRLTLQKESQLEKWMYIIIYLNNWHKKSPFLAIENGELGIIREKHSRKFDFGTLSGLSANFARDEYWHKYFITCYRILQEKLKGSKVTVIGDCQIFLRSYWVIGLSVTVVKG